MTLPFLLASNPNYTYFLGQNFLDCLTLNLGTQCFSGMTVGDYGPPIVMPAELMVVLLLSFLIYPFVFIFYYSPKEGPNNCHQTKLKASDTLVLCLPFCSWRIELKLLQRACAYFHHCFYKTCSSRCSNFEIYNVFSRLCLLGSEPA